MTREDIEREYDVVEGVVQSPGKFEGESSWAVWAWGETLDGCCEEICWPDETRVFLVDLDDADRATWGFTVTTKYLACEESEQGFVSCVEWTVEDYERSLADSEAAWAEYEESET